MEEGEGRLLSDSRRAELLPPASSFSNRLRSCTMSLAENSATETPRTEESVDTEKRRGGERTGGQELVLSTLLPVCDEDIATRQHVPGSASLDMGV